MRLTESEMEGMDNFSFSTYLEVLTTEHQSVSGLTCLFLPPFVGSGPVFTPKCGVKGLWMLGESGSRDPTAPAWPGREVCSCGASGPLSSIVSWKGTRATPVVFTMNANSLPTRGKAEHPNINRLYHQSSTADTHEEVVSAWNPCSLPRLYRQQIPGCRTWARHESV